MKVNKAYYFDETNELCIECDRDVVKLIERALIETVKDLVNEENFGKELHDALRGLDQINKVLEEAGAAGEESSDGK